MFVLVKLETPDNLDAHTSDENLISHETFKSDLYSNIPSEHMQISELKIDSMPKSMDSSDSSIQSIIISLICNNNLYPLLKFIHIFRRGK